MPPAPLLALLLSLPLAAQEPTRAQLTAEGYDHFFNLEYPQALHDFEAAAALEPDSPGAWNHIAHAVLYDEMFRNGALESQLVSGSNPFLTREKLRATPKDRERFAAAIAKAMALAQKSLDANPNDVSALYSLGISYGLRANYDFLVRKAWTDALRDATEARELHNRATTIDPDFVDARLLQGVYDYVVGSLPVAYRILGFVAGFHGNRERGIETLEDVVAHAESNRTDAAILLAAIYRREKRPEDAIPLLDSLEKRYPRNYLFVFEKVQMYSDMGEKQKALDVIQTIEDRKAAGAPGFSRIADGKIRYLRGNLLFWYGDLAPALDDLKRVTAHPHEIDLNTALMAWMRQGQILDLDGRRKLAARAYRHAVALAPRSAIAKECRAYLSSPYLRPAATKPG